MCCRHMTYAAAALHTVMTQRQAVTSDVAPSRCKLVPLYGQVELANESRVMTAYLHAVAANLPSMSTRTQRKTTARPFEISNLMAHLGLRND